MITAHPFLLNPFPQSVTRHSSKAQVILPPEPIQVGLERVHRQNLLANAGQALPSVGGALLDLEIYLYLKRNNN